MKKILLALGSIGILGTLIGVISVQVSQPKVDPSLKLKAPLGKIISWRVEKEAVIVPVSQMLGGGVATSTTSTEMTPLVKPAIQLVDVVHYKFVTDIIATATPYFDKENTGNLSNAELLPSRADGIRPIAFYADPVFYRTQNKIYNIGDATTTLVAFNEQMKPTLADSVRSIFFNSALATSTFNSSNTYTPNTTGTIQILIVAGGGGGSQVQGRGGGGGGGGVIYNSAFSVNSGVVYPVTVGSGGTAGNHGGMGGYSAFGIATSSDSLSYLVSYGGGWGGVRGSCTGFYEGGIGGSGGGGSACNAVSTPGKALIGQGNDGGAALSSAPSFGGGGGGGALSVGGTAISTQAGNGGDGRSFAISGASTTYGGGGGGAANDAGKGIGGLGGGGNGASEGVSNGGAGTANTGGGGGGGSDSNVAGAGGSGIIIIAFTTTTASGGTCATAAPSTGISFCSN